MTPEQQAALAKIQEQSRKTMEAVAASQDTYVSERWGVTRFHEAPKGWGPDKVCSRCILERDSEDCDNARCSPGFRTDRKDGYFTIQEMPEENWR